MFGVGRWALSVCFVLLLSPSSPLGSTSHESLLTFYSQTDYDYEHEHEFFIRLPRRPLAKNFGVAQ